MGLRADRREHQQPQLGQADIHEHTEGKGKWLYEPASDDPELCPGGDWSRYECSTCGKFVKPFSNDQGDLICPTCEATGLVILDDEQLDRLEQVREFARLMGLDRQLERQLCFLAREWSGEKTDQCVLGYDFAPHSFRLRPVHPARLREIGRAHVLLQRRLDLSRTELPGRWLVPLAHRQPRQRHRLVLPYVSDAALVGKARVVVCG